MSNRRVRAGVGGLGSDWAAAMEGSASSLFLFLALSLIAVAVTLDAWLQERDLLLLPGSVTTMVLGLACGIVLRLAKDSELEQVLQFDGELFVLVLVRANKEEQISADDPFSAEKLLLFLDSCR